jgi:predicted nucleic acid-binding protein
VANRYLRVVAGETATPSPVTLVDSCVLLDIATNDPKWGEWSAEKMAEALDEGELVINPVIYAEVSVGYPSLEMVDELLPPDDCRREPLPYEAAFLVGKAFQKYRKNGGQKRSPLPDFYIGAHAAVAGFRLLTRDATRYRTYFPKLELICPS